MADTPAADSGAAEVTAAEIPAEPVAELAATGPGTADNASAGQLPVPNYAELSVASLRARLRMLDATQVRMLLDYEQAHAARPTVITMFERRIAKLAEGS